MGTRYTRRQIQEAIAYWEKQIRLGNYRKINESADAGKLKKIADAINSEINGIHAEYCKPKACVDGNRGDKYDNVDAIYLSVYSNMARDGYGIDDFIDEITDISKKFGIALKSGNIVYKGYQGFIVPEYTTLTYADIDRKSLNESDGEFEKIDDIVAFLDDKDVKWKKATKTKPVNAVQAKGGEKVKTVGSDGNEETSRTAKEGDWIVNNVGNPDNKWIIDGGTFSRKYKADDKKKGQYIPWDGKKNAPPPPMLAAKVSDVVKGGKGVKFAPPNWGGDVIQIKNDGWFMKDPNNEKDIYAISKLDFDSSYELK